MIAAGLTTTSETLHPVEPPQTAEFRAAQIGSDRRERKPMADGHETDIEERYQGEVPGEAREDPDRIAEGQELGLRFGRAPWPDMMRGLTGKLGKLVAEFRRSEALAPPGKEGLLQHVTAHEQALRDFAESEVAGHAAERSLAPVLALLTTFGPVREHVRISRKGACLRRSACAGFSA
jgi:hypothetical protein